MDGAGWGTDGGAAGGVGDGPGDGPGDGEDGGWREPGLAQYTALLSRCDLVEITGGVDFDRAADFCMEYLLHG